MDLPTRPSVMVDIKLHEERGPHDQNQKERQPEQQEPSVEAETNPDCRDPRAEHQRHGVNRDVKWDEKQ